MPSGPPLCTQLSRAVSCSSAGDENESPSSRRSFFTQLQLRLSNLFGFRGRDAIPAYWENAHKDLKQALHRSSPDFFDDVFPVSRDERGVLQELMNHALASEDAEFRVIRALRIEHSILWGRYQRRTGRIQKKRGECSFKGNGVPTTAEAIADLAGLADFTQDLDPSICEAYLWHGTRPQTALRIAQSGFEVDRRSAAGKRFGAGGYFAEDPSRADKYAGAGEGLYQNCFAMLLCRVALGEQFHVKDFKAEDATAQARGRHDSTLAEPRMASWREFVVFDSGQVYPEYALVYERHKRNEGKHDELAFRDAEYARQYSRQSSGSSLASSEEEDNSLPAYWFHSRGGSSYFHDSCPAETIEPVIQTLLERTWDGQFTVDRKGADGLHIKGDDPNGDMPEGLRLLKVLRVEDSQLWSEYVSTQNHIRHERGAAVIPVTGVKTVDGLPRAERGRLAADVNEVYLWHGSSPEVVTNIALSGFPQKLSTFNRGMFGEGAYFVEDSAHADEYSEDDKDGYYLGYFAMLLCRVTLGRAQVLPQVDLHAHTRLGRGRAFDSTIGEVVASAGTFREFVVAERSQIYPEYAIIYERKFKQARVRAMHFGGQ